jgi:uncharacterized RDD family membrane protein YckC
MGTPAGLWVRILANIVDIIVWTVLIAVLSYICALIFGSSLELIPLIAQILVSVGVAAIPIYMLTKYGTTPGKQYLGMRVQIVGTTTPPGVGRSLWRELGAKYLGMIGASVICAPLAAGQLLNSDILENGDIMQIAISVVGWTIVAPLVLGIIIVALPIAIRKDRRGLHDLLAGTEVVYK